MQQGKERAMQERRCFKQIDPLAQRLSEDAQYLRKEAQGTPPGVERDRLILRARYMETAREWLSLRVLKGPT